MSTSQQPSNDTIAGATIPPEFAEVFGETPAPPPPPERGAAVRDTLVENRERKRRAFLAKKAERQARPNFKSKDLGDDIVTLIVKWVDRHKVRNDFARAQEALRYATKNLPRAWKQAFLTPE